MTAVLAAMLARRRACAVAVLLIAASLVAGGQAARASSASGMPGVSVSAGLFHTCAVESGRAYCWGDNSYGELGNGSTGGSSSVPVPVDMNGVLAGKTLTQITTGYDDTCALDSSGAAYCWGYDYYGELGDGTTANSSVPVAVDMGGVLAGKTLNQISAGHVITCALDTGGAAYCWGYDNEGELGNGGTVAASVPVAVDTSGVLAGKTLTQISTGYEFTCALDSVGAAYCWGDNNTGQLGNGTTTSTSGLPVAVDTSGVLAGKTLASITTGEGLHACALDSGGTAYCWGYNNAGQLGNGTTATSDVPVAVDTSGTLAGETLTQISAAAEHTCALDAAGTAYCWGVNGYGELGNGDLTGSVTPVAVDTSGVLAGKTLTRITAQGYHACAVDIAGALYCWGGDPNGELGNNTVSTGSAEAVLAGPEAPTGVTAVPGTGAATVSWSQPASLDTGTLTGYTATADPGDHTCTTTGATTCTITGLTGGTCFEVTVIAHTTAGDSGASAPACVTPGSGIAFTSEPDDTVAFGSAFSFTVTATGSPQPAMAKAGKLPPGVRFKRGGSGTATISGTPRGSASGTYHLTLTAKNKSGTATQTFTLTVIRASSIKQIPATTISTGSPLNLPVTAIGYPVPALTESGSLPAGVAFTDYGNGTAAIAGTPSPGSQASYRITVTATNASGTASRTFVLKVIAP
jgi:alpha-tubulin suppressor-like RCC1 family protein